MAGRATAFLSPRRDSTCNLPEGPKGKRPLDKLNIVFLSLPTHRLHFYDQPTQRLEEPPAADENASVETRWCQLRDAIHLTGLAVLGRSLRLHQDWFNDSDATISYLLGEKNRLQTAYLNRSTDANKAAFYQFCRLAQQRLQEIQGIWMTRKAKEIQEYFDHNESKNFLVAIKVINAPFPTKAIAPLLNSNG
ncbi:hypothetical protein SprV_0200568200 [Sparganum proliferum]